MNPRDAGLFRSGVPAVSRRRAPVDPSGDFTAIAGVIRGA